MAKNIFYLALCLALTSAIGCGGAPSDMPELGSVTGTVTLAGKALADAIVEFRPAEGRPSSGKTNETGAYTLQYTSDYNGAKIGEHSVVVSLPGSEQDYGSDEQDEDSDSASGLPANASDGSLKTTVKSGSNEFNIDL